MEFGQIIKKAWRITWRHRFLWVLGIFAGITGAGGGGGSYNRSYSSGRPGTWGSSGPPFTAAGAGRFAASMERWIPVIIAGVTIWILLALLFWALSLAARGGLVWAVDELEEGRRPTLGSAWTRGFSHIWSVLGLGLMLQLPMLVAVIALGAAIAVPIVLAFAKGGRFAPAAIVPACGALAIGIPLLLVMGFILGIMYVIALRRVVLDRVGAVQSAKDAWMTFRARFKDTALMWLINWGLNVAASLVLAIPIVVLTFVFAIPGFVAGAAGRWGVVAGLVAVWLLIVIAISVLYAGIWGTFTSALWTILYRRLTGREVVVHPTPYSGAPAAAAQYAPPAYPMPGQPSPGTPPAGYPAPPSGGWASPPAETPGWSPDAQPPHE